MTLALPPALRDTRGVGTFGDRVEGGRMHDPARVRGSSAVPAFEVRASHNALLAPLEETAGVGLVPDTGVVVVPASRPGNRLTTGALLACELGWPLLALCSRELTAPTVRARLRGVEGLRLTAADLAASTLLRAARDWEAVDHPAARQRAHIDTNRKRNLALCVAAMTGRSWLLFVDDDVTGLGTGMVRAAVSHLVRRPQQWVVGWPHRDFPDNSVVHHARRDVMGWPQDCFVGGGALLVHLAGAPPPPFPPVYNEDWLFLFDALARGEVAGGPAVGQLAYDPFGDAGRARLEEFGDVLAEGLFHLLHEGLPADVATAPGYWADVCSERRKLLGRIVDRARELSVAAPAARAGRLDDVIGSVTEARRQHTWVTPGALADFVGRWRRDQQVWSDFYGGLPARDTLEEALVRLGMHEAWVVTSGASG